MLKSLLLVIVWRVWIRAMLWSASVIDLHFLGILCFVAYVLLCSILLTFLMCPGFVLQVVQVQRSMGIF
jgi:hypothetical protein